MILVTGASSAAGRELVRALLDAGREVRPFLRDPARLPAELRDRTRPAIGDFARPATLAPALEGVSALYLTSFDHPETVAWQTNVLDAAKAAGITRIVRLSAPAADPQSAVNFARWHGEMERRVARSGVAYTHLRPNWYMDNFLEDYMAGGVLRLPAGAAPISLIDARDIAAVAARALLEPGHEGQTYELTGPAAITHAEVAAALSRATGRRFRYEDVNLGVFAGELVAAGTPAWRVEMDVDLFKRLIDGENAPVTDRVERITGRRAFSIADHARDWADAYAALA